MFGVLLSVGVAVMIAALLAKRGLAKAGKQTGLRWTFWSNLGEVLVCYVVVGSLFIAVSFWAQISDAPDTTLRALWQVEKWLSALSRFASRWRVPSAVALVLLMGLAFADYLLKTTFPEKIYGWFDRYQKIWKRFVLISTALASFSIFSGALPGALAHVEARLKSTTEQYSQYARELDAGSTEFGTDQALLLVNAALPEEWRSTAEREVAINRESNVLRRRLVALKQHLAGEAYPSEPARAAAPSRGSDSTQDQTTPSEREEPMARADMDGDASETRLQAIRNELQSQVATIEEHAGQLLQTSLGSKLPQKAVGDLLSHKHLAALKVLSTEYPLLDALLGVLDNTLTEAVATRLKIAVTKLRRKPVEGVAQVFVEESQRVLSTTSIDWVAVHEQVNRTGTETTEELLGIERALEQCNQIETQALDEIRREWQAAETNNVDSKPPRPVTRPGRSEVADILDPPPENGQQAMDSVVTAIQHIGDFQHRDEMIGDFRIIVRGSGSYREKTENLFKLAKEPQRQQQLELTRRQERSLGLEEGSFSSYWETARERSLRLERQGVQQAEISHRIIEEHDRVLASMASLERRTSPGETPSVFFKIGDLEVDGIPLRALIPREGIIP